MDPKIDQGPAEVGGKERGFNFSWEKCTHCGLTIFVYLSYSNQHEILQIQHKQLRL